MNPKVDPLYNGVSDSKFCRRCDTDRGIIRVVAGNAGVRYNLKRISTRTEQQSLRISGEK